MFLNKFRIIFRPENYSLVLSTIKNEICSQKKHRNNTKKSVILSVFFGQQISCLIGNTTKKIKVWSKYYEKLFQKYLITPRIHYHDLRTQFGECRSRNAKKFVKLERNNQVFDLFGGSDTCP